MTIEELSDVIEVNLILTRYSGQNNRWSCKFEYTSVKNDKADIMLRGVHGNGKTPLQAISDYVTLIQGKRLVIGHGEERREFGVPSNLEP